MHHAAAMIVVTIGYVVVFWAAWDTFRDWPWIDPLSEAEDDCDTAS